MKVKNCYPELPEVAYQHTSVDMNTIIVFGKSLIGKYKIETVRMAYAIFRNESANGTKGVNNNYAGIQADNARWKNLPGTPIATCVKLDSGNQYRRFLCFNEDGYKVGFELLCIKIEERKMITVKDYFDKWVGNPNPSPDHMKNIKLLLDAAAKKI